MYVLRSHLLLTSHVRLGTLIMKLSQHGKTHTAMSMTFERHKELNYRLISIQLAFENHDIDIEDHAKQLDVLFGRLSSADICKCSTNLVRREDPGVRERFRQQTIEEAYTVYYRLSNAMVGRRSAKLLEITHGKEVMKPLDADEAPLLKLVFVKPDARTVWIVEEEVTIEW